MKILKVTRLWNDSVQKNFQIYLKNTIYLEKFRSLSNFSIVIERVLSNFLHESNKNTLKIYWEEFKLVRTNFFANYITQSNINQDIICKVCYEHTIDTCIIHDHHVCCICDACSASLASYEMHNCPFCKLPIQQYKKLIIP